MGLPKIIDNERVNLADTLLKVAEEHDTISIATGYWDLPGTEKLIQVLKDYKNIRLLIGKEPQTPNGISSKPEEDYPALMIKGDLSELSPSNKHYETILQIRKLMDEGVLKVKIYRKQFLHAKCYIFGTVNSTNAVGIIGSSNFTEAGLSRNRELNALNQDNQQVVFQPLNSEQEHGHLSWFDDIWKDPEAEEWNGKFLDILEKSPHGESEFSPYEMYIKTLYEIFKDDLEDTADIKDDGSSKKLTGYQIRGVHSLKRRLDKYGVAMLADSVGLGKTITAIEVIKQYILDPNKRRARVEIIVPKSIKLQWESEMAEQQLISNFAPEVTSFQNENAINKRKNFDRIAEVDLFVIDESHNLRSSNGSRFAQMLDWIENNPHAHVLLLTATPVNNQLSDLTTQIKLALRGDENKLKVQVRTKRGFVEKGYASAIEDIDTEFKRQITAGEKPDYEAGQIVLREVIKGFVVRNTRLGVMADPEFDGKFPNSHPKPVEYSFNQTISDEILKLNPKDIPLQKVYKVDSENLIDLMRQKRGLHPLRLIEDVASVEEVSPQSIYLIFQTILMLGLPMYRWRLYKDSIYGKTSDDISKILKPTPNELLLTQLQAGIHGIIQVSYLKRLESSTAAIRKSIINYQTRLTFFEVALRDNDEFVGVKDFAKYQEYLDGNLDSDTAEEKGVVHLSKISEKGYLKDILLEDIEKDQALLKVILDQLDVLGKDDSKLNKLAEILTSIKETEPAGKKVLLFSYFSDTIEDLENKLIHLCPWINEDNSAFITGKNKSKVENLTNRFAPVAKYYPIGPDEQQIDFLFSTDVLSEGQNLQDCGIVINYDLHWNPVRMIQRNGRVNRLGSPHTDSGIYIYNMFPESQLEIFLALVKRLQLKIDRINFSIGLDQPVLDENFNAIEYVDTVKDIYDLDEEKVQDAYRKAEEVSDILSSDDTYVNDLKSFDATATPELKQKVLQISKGKWGALPSRNKRNEEVIIGAMASSESGKTRLVFGRTGYKAGRIEAIPDQIALSKIRANIADSPVISIKNIVRLIPREEIETLTKQSLLTSQQGASNKLERQLYKQEIEVLEILGNYHYPQEDIITVRQGFTLVNHAFRQRDIKKAYKEVIKDRQNTEKINALITLCRESLDAVAQRDSQEEDGLPINITPFLYHVG